MDKRTESQMRADEALLDKFKRMTAFANDPLGGQSGDGYFDFGDGSNGDCHAYLDQYLSQCNHLRPQVIGMLETETVVAALTPAQREFTKPANCSTSLGSDEVEAWTSFAQYQPQIVKSAMGLIHILNANSSQSEPIVVDEQEVRRLSEEGFAAVLASHASPGSRPANPFITSSLIMTILDLIAWIVLKLTDGKGEQAKKAFKKFRMQMSKETIEPTRITVGSINDKSDWYLQQAILGETSAATAKYPDSYDPLGPAGPEPEMMARGENNKWCQEMLGSWLKRCVVPEQI